jgi:hypothetical protein
MLSDIKLELFTRCHQLKSDRAPSRHGVRPEAAAVAYLALLLRRAREWFLTAKRDIIGHLARLHWSVNLGVPSPCIEDNEENRRFQRVGKAAWMLSVLDDCVTLRKAEDELRYVTESPEYWERDDDGTACEFTIVPEIAAGAIGYASSVLRREGLHLMVDIGASTIDACSFVLYERSGDDHYSLLTADVQSLGTTRLHEERLLAMSKAHADKMRELRDRHDPLAPISECLEPYLLADDRVLASILGAEGEFKQNCQRMLRRLILDLRRRRYPTAAVWTGKLPILLIGGGGESTFFRTMVEEMSEWLRFTVGSQGAVLLPVHVPTTVSAIPSEQHRLAVAWGLSHQDLQIGEIVPADRIADIEAPQRRQWEDRFVSKDHT